MGVKGSAATTNHIIEVCEGGGVRIQPPKRPAPPHPKKKLTPPPRPRNALGLKLRGRRSLTSCSSRW
jgi:hypothetical protein